VNPNDFFKQASLNNTRGHMYKLYKQRHHTNVGASFFASRVNDVTLLSIEFGALFEEEEEDVWNYLPENIVDFSSLSAFQRTITLVDFNVS